MKRLPFLVKGAVLSPLVKGAAHPRLRSGIFRQFALLCCCAKPLQGNKRKASLFHELLAKRLKFLHALLGCLWIVRIQPGQCIQDNP